MEDPLAWYSELANDLPVDTTVADADDENEASAVEDPTASTVDDPATVQNADPSLSELPDTVDDPAAEYTELVLAPPTTDVDAEPEDPATAPVIEELDACAEPEPADDPTENRNDTPTVEVEDEPEDEYWLLAVDCPTEAAEEDPLADADADPAWLTPETVDRPDELYAAPRIVTDTPDADEVPDEES